MLDQREALAGFGAVEHEPHPDGAQEPHLAVTGPHDLGCCCHFHPAPPFDRTVVSRERCSTVPRGLSRLIEQLWLIKSASTANSAGPSSRQKRGGGSPRARLSCTERWGQRAPQSARSPSAPASAAPPCIGTSQTRQPSSRPAQSTGWN